MKRMRARRVVRGKCTERMRARCGVHGKCTKRMRILARREREMYETDADPRAACVGKTAGREKTVTSGIIEIDVHGKNVEEALREISGQVARAGDSVYRIRVIHGYHGGTRISEGIRDEFGYGREPRVKRIQMGQNPGITELVLREF